MHDETDFVAMIADQVRTLSWADVPRIFDAPRREEGSATHDRPTRAALDAGRAQPATVLSSVGSGRVGY